MSYLLNFEERPYDSVPVTLPDWPHSILLHIYSPYQCQKFCFKDKSSNTFWSSEERMQLNDKGQKNLAINIASLILSLKWHFDSLIYPLSVNTSNLITLSFASRAKEVYMYLLPFFNSFDISVYFFNCIVISTCRCIQKLLMISSHFLTILFIDQDCFSSWTRTLIVHTSVVGDTGGRSNHPALTWILRNWTVGFMIAKKALYLLNCLSELSIVL